MLKRLTNKFLFDEELVHKYSRCSTDEMSGVKFDSDYQINYERTHAYIYACSIYSMQEVYTHDISILTRSEYFDIAWLGAVKVEV